MNSSRRHEPNGSEAISYCNEQRSDLALIAERTRSALVDRFPYGILGYVDGDTIVVTSVMNLRQEPRSAD